LLAALLASGGEFAFVVFKTAETALLLSKEQAALLNVIVAIAMAATPLLVLAAQRFNQYKQRQEPKRAFDQIDNNAARVIIAGFGRVGQIPARILSAHKIPYTVIDSDTDQVEVARKFGIGLVYYGDTTRPDTLRAAKIQDAEVVVLALEDPELSIRTARTVKALNPTVKIIATARHRRHVHKLMDMGIPDAIRETYHSALTLSHRMLEAIGFSNADADDRIARFRKVDEAALIEQYTFHDDEAQLIQSAASYRDELERLFETDRAVSESEQK
jgi:glutathione-regulated potassium-efflux system protein KefB